MNNKAIIEDFARPWTKIRQMGRWKFVLRSAIGFTILGGGGGLIARTVNQGFDLEDFLVTFGAGICVVFVFCIVVGIVWWAVAERMHDLAMKQIGQPKTAPETQVEPNRATLYNVHTTSMSMASEHTIKVFLCHASEDKPAVRELYRRLQAVGIDPWLDQEELLPGQDWQLEIRNAVRASHAVIVCLSPRSVDKEGFIQKEIRYILDIADEKPEGTIFVVPVLVEKCNIPVRLSRWQWVDSLDDTGFEKRLRALRIRAEDLDLKAT